MWSLPATDVAGVWATDEAWDKDKDKDKDKDEEVGKAAGRD